MHKTPTRVFIQRAIVKLLLSFSSFSGVLYFYVVTKQDFPFLSVQSVGLDTTNSFLVRNGFYMAVFAAFAYLTLRLTRLSFKAVDTLKVSEEKPIESVAVPTYIGLFVIAIGLATTDAATSGIVLFMLFLFWTRLEKIFYFNPIWLFFGYRFYEAKSAGGNTFTLVTKRDRLKGTQNFSKLRRLNNYTYLESK